MSVRPPRSRGRATPPGAMPRPQRTPSANDIFLAKNQPTPVTAQEIFHDEDTARPDNPNSDTEIEHTHAGTVRMWRLTSTGSVPVQINKNSLLEAIKGGMSPTCHDCGEDHDGGPNDCPMRAPRQFRRCPHPGCRKPLYDPVATGMAVVAVNDDDDPNAIVDDKLGASTPATRTLELVRRHVAGFHKDDLQLYFPGTPADILGPFLEEKTG